MKMSDVASYLGIVGAIMVSLNYPLIANIIWGITNPVLIYHMHKLEQYPQRNMFIVFTVVAWFGIYNLSR